LFGNNLFILKFFAKRYPLILIQNIPLGIENFFFLYFIADKFC